MNHIQVPFSILREPAVFLEEIKRGEGIRTKIIGCLVASFLMFAFYGAIIGTYSGPMQAAISAVKLPFLFVTTVLICLPTLHVACLLLGAREHVGQVFAVLTATLAVTAVLLVSFAPVTAFFLMTSSNYQFFKLLNVAIFTISGFVGVRFFRHAMHTLWGEDKPVRARVLTPWIILYAFVGTQLGWTLRPFFGAPGVPFQIVREAQDNFYTDVFRSAGEVLGIRD